MRLSKVLEGVVHSRVGVPGDPEICGVAYDSRQVKPGFLFVCISGFKTDGHLFVKDARERGAAAILAEKETADCDLPVALCDDSRQALARVAGNFHHHPSRQLRLIGVTGTNGKTTTTHLIKAILEEAGKKTGILGTLYARVGGESFDLGHTTPEAPDIEAFLKVCREQQAEYVVM